MALPDDLYRKAAQMKDAVETDDVMIHYTVNDTCPFHCSGCINALTARRLDPDPGPSASDGGADLTRDGRAIVHLIRESGLAEAVVVFYGGEPMLRADRMAALFQQIPSDVGRGVAVRFMVITSGHFLERAVRDYPEMMRSIWLTAVSVDGTEAQHNAMRNGTDLGKIRRQLSLFSRIRNGEVLIWSTLRPGMSLLDCFDSFLHLLDRQDAQHFFWHWDEAEGTIQDLDLYRRDYGRDLERILDTYVGRLRNGQMLSLVHVNELFLYLFTGRRRGTTACAVENMANFDITGDGRIHACADLPQTMNIGSISPSGEVRFEPDARQRLEALVRYKAELGCDRCGVEPYCGGRCPVQIHVGGIQRARQYCFLMRDHVRIVKGRAAEVLDAMIKAGVSLQGLYLSARMAKYADVTP